MYAIVSASGRQMKAAKDEILVVDHIEGEPGQKVELDDVVLVHTGNGLKIGSPYVAGAKVRTEIVRQVKSKKVNAFNYKPKKNVRKRWGHRQQYTQLRVLEVLEGK